MLSKDVYDLLLKRFKYDDGSIMKELMKDEPTVDTINACDVTKLIILLDTNKFRNNLITRLLDFNAVEERNLFNDEASKVQQHSKISIQHQKLQLFLDYDKDSNKTMINILKNMGIIEGINGIDYERFKLLFTWVDYVKCTALNLIEESFVNVIDTTNLKFIKFLIDYEKFYDGFITNLLEDDNIVNVINSIDIDKMNRLFLGYDIFYNTIKNTFDFVQKPTNNASYFPECEIRILMKECDEILETMEVILYEIDVVNAINVMDNEKFEKLLIYGFRDANILKILQNSNAINTINLLENEKLDILLTTVTFDEKVIKIMEYAESAKAIKSIPNELFQQSNQSKLLFSIILEIFKMKNLNCPKILEPIIEIGNCAYEKVYEFIDALGLDRLSVLLERDGHFKVDHYSDLLVTTAMSDENILNAIKKIYIRKFEILLRNYNNVKDEDILILLKNERWINSINSLDFAKFKLIFENQKIRDETLIHMFRNSKYIDIINSVNVEKFEILLEWIGKNYDLERSTRFGDDQIIWDQITLDRLLRNDNFVDFVRKIDAQKLKILCFYLILGNEMLVYLLKFAHEIIFDINPVKLKFLFRKRFLVPFLAKDFDLIYMINSMHIDNLIVIEKILNVSDFYELFSIKDFDIRRNLMLAASLHKVGRVEKFGLDYLRNDDDTLYADVIKVFPSKYPIRKMLNKVMPYKIENETLIPKLEDLCITTFIAAYGSVKSDVVNKVG